MYTIQSTLNFKYICELYSLNHNLSFIHTTQYPAHTWYNRIDAVSVAVSLGHCIVVPMPKDV